MKNPHLLANHRLAPMMAIATLLACPLTLVADSYTPYEEFSQRVRALNDHDLFTVTVEGESAGGEDILFVKGQHVARSSEPWKVFLVGSQHGDEVAGREAILALLEEYAQTPEALPQDVELYVLPAVNPDGAIDYKRRNDNDFDLNRDHAILSQPETQTIHRLAREILPHVSVDCHEYTRDSGRYGDLGFVRWPDIMMDAGNHPLLHPDLFEAGVRWVDSATPAMEKSGINYSRYYVGGPPPREELRYSTLDSDDCRNGLAMYGGLSFIIESGVYRGSDHPQADLDMRIDGYTILLKRFIEETSYRDQDRRTIAAARNRMVPPAIPTNFFWGNNGLKVVEYPVLDKETKGTQLLETGNFMEDIIVKKTIPRPEGYAIVGDHIAKYVDLLDAHGIDYEPITEAMTVSAESYNLIRIDNSYDELYNRYAGRQITRPSFFPEQEIPAGSIYVPLEQSYPLRIPAILEPAMLFGLYQWDEWQETIGDDNVIPVYRVMER